MDNPNYSIEHKKGQHLTNEERGIIQAHLRDGWNPNQIANDLGRPYNTIKNEIKRGTVLLYDGKVERYKAEVGAETYREHRKNCVRQYKRLKVSPFISYVEEQFFSADQWSPDASFGNALLTKKFTREEMVCTKTLYNYIDKKLIRIKNIDLPEKLKRSTKQKVVRENIKKLGTSIEERPKDIETREEFGHWEMDSVLGCKNADEPVALTLVERMTRNSIWIKADNHSATEVTKAIDSLKSEYGEHFSDVFKSITADNGSEFAELWMAEAFGTKVYFTHPFSSWEKGTNERHNRLLRRFIPKGHSMRDYSDDDIAFIADWSNALPRKILGYHTPEDLFERNLDIIYSA